MTRAGERVALSPKAFEVLACLVANPGRIISKDELMKTVWPDSFVEEGNLAQHISGLRKAMGDRADLIVTVPGRGYQFAAPVEQVVETALAEPERGGETVVQRVRERTRIVVTETALPALPAPATRPLGLTQRGWMAAVAAAAIVVAAVSIYLWKRSVPPPESRKVVVADFVNATGDPALDQTLKRALEIDLGQSPYLDVMGQGEAARTLQLMGKPPASALTPDVAKELCVRTNRQVVLAGTIASVGREYLLTLQATDCNSSRPVAGAKAEAGSKEKILAALDSVAGRVRAGLGESKLSLESFQVPIEQATTSSLEALKAYSMGSYLNVDDSQKLAFFQKAIQLDPQFALAYSRIATVYYNNGEVNVAT
ncbi:MAG: winged helix-turn-helix domain-containing protein, partial [Acidobacteriaceae bacterium]